jgi:hypothetical protein
MIFLKYAVMNLKVDWGDSLGFVRMEFEVSLDRGFTVDLLHQNLMASLIQRF